MCRGVPAVLLHCSGPLVGGVLSDHFGWRSTFIFTTCMAGAVILPLLLFFLPGEAQRFEYH
jgi:predicted MFS family arabinose efflux permease